MNRIQIPRATFVQLRSFEAVARLGSVTRAAHELHLAQPTVSTQMKELASGLGHAVLAPAGRGIRLTDAGVELQKAVRSLFQTWAAFEAIVDDQAGQVRGVLRVAGVTTSEYFVARLLQAFLAKFPDVQVELAVENRGNVVARLDRGDDDCAIMMLPPADQRLGKLPFLANPLVAIANTGHAWARRSRTKRAAIPLTEFLAAPLLMREAGSGTRRVTELHAAEHGVIVEARMTLGSNEAIKHAVAAGLGVAVVSRHALAERTEQEGLSIIKVVSLPIERAWQLVWRKDGSLSSPARAFIDYVRSNARIPGQRLTAAGERGSGTS